VTSTLGKSQARSVDLLPPTLQTIPEAIGKNIAIARARTRSRIMAVVKADGYGHGAITVARAAIAAGAEWLGTTDIAEASELRAAGLTVPILTWLNPSGVDAEAAAADQIDIAIGSVDDWRHCSSTPPPAFESTGDGGGLEPAAAQRALDGGGGFQRDFVFDVLSAADDQDVLRHAIVLLTRGPMPVAMVWGMVPAQRAQSRMVGVTPSCGPNTVAVVPSGT
jgi:alanine racemase-like protein